MAKKGLAKGAHLKVEDAKVIVTLPVGLPRLGILDVSGARACLPPCEEGTEGGLQRFGLHRTLVPIPLAAKPLPSPPLVRGGLAPCKGSMAALRLG
jgi:hypothetical protein